MTYAFAFFCGWFSAYAIYFTQAGYTDPAAWCAGIALLNAVLMAIDEWVLSL